LRATHLGRTYPIGHGAFVEALVSVDLALSSGERLAVVGPSGSGKSTLLGLLAGFDRPTTGEVIVDGRSLGRLSSGELVAYRRCTIGFVFQTARLLAHLSALANVMLPLVLMGVAERERARRAAELLERVGLGERVQHFPAQLSGGEQQRVALARALVNRPRLLLADEPTAGLDRATAAGLADWLLDLGAEQQLTLVVATHDLSLAARCQRVLDLGGPEASAAAA
jgi:putative ABC transport system ATP-binding protein